MKRLNLILPIILGYLLLANHALAAQWAVVQSDKAVIFSDINMTSAIGFIKKGKRIRVGEVSRNQSQVLPTIVGGKVAYIKTSDIKAGRDVDRIKSAIERARDGSTKRTSVTRFSIYPSFQISQVDFGAETGLVDVDQAETITGYGIGINGHYDNLVNNKAYRVGFEYTMGSKDNITLDILKLNLDLPFYLYRTDSSSLDIYGAVIVAPSAQYIYKGLFSVVGSGYGARVGAYWMKHVNDVKSYFFDLSYEYLKITGLDFPENQGIPARLEPTLHTLNIKVGYSFNF